MTPALSIVVPVHNEDPADLRATLQAAADAIARSDWRDGADIVVVDDGSEPPVEAPQLGVPVVVLRQENRGRFEARRAGVQRARGDHVLLLDARVRLAPGALEWVAPRVTAGERVWNGHCEIAESSKPYARFWNVLTAAAFSHYLSNPRTTSFGLEEYDQFPKGTGHFLAPRKWLLEAIDGFESHYSDSRFASDDTHMLRAIAARERINISPSFASTYRSRESLRPFLRHALHRGTTLVDGFGRPGTRFFPAVVATFPLTLGGIALAVARPFLALGALAGLALAAFLVALSRRHGARDASAFASLVVPFSVTYAAGIWRGAWLALRARGERTA